MGRLVVAMVVLAAVAAAAPAAAHVDAQSVRVHAAAPFGGDHRLLTTITPNGDGLRDRAVVRFRLEREATVRFAVRRGKPAPRVVHRAARRFGPGLHRFVWAPPASTPVGTYVAELTVAGAPRARAVVRVRGVDASFRRLGYRPGELATLTVATDAHRLTLQFLELGPERERSVATDRLTGVEVGEPLELSWAGRADRPHRVRVRLGAWRSGVYALRLTADDGRVGYAPFVLRPARPTSRVAVVVPTYTWQAYNFWDDDADGIGDTWYAGWTQRTVRLGRPFLNRGVPPKFSRYDLPFLHWLHWRGKEVDFLAEPDLARWGARRLAAAYELLVLPGHHEYATRGMYDAVEGYRDRGGNLLFLSANNFFWRVDRRGALLEKVALWRDLGRPEAALAGVQYRRSDQGERRRPFVVRRSRAGEWLFAGTGLRPGSRFGSFGIEIDATTPASPRGTQVVAEIPHLFGRGATAQMAYYETRRGARVFSAGALDFGAWALSPPVDRILENLWARLAPEEPERDPAAASAAPGTLTRLPSPRTRRILTHWPYGIAVSRDGRSVYVASGYESSYSAIGSFRRDARTGALTQLPGRAGCVRHSVNAARLGCTPGGRLNTPSELAVTPDGRQVLTVNPIWGVLLGYRRDGRTGALAHAPCGPAATCQLAARAMPRPEGLAVSPDGRNVYVASSDAVAHRGLAVFRRDPAAGSIEQLPGLDGCVQRTGDGGPGGPCALPPIDAFTPRAVSVSPDGRHVYVYSAAAAGHALVAFSRGAGGALTALPEGRACVSAHVAGCTFARLPRRGELALSPDGRTLYVAGETIVAFARSPETGALTPVARTCATACRGGDIAVAPDGRSVYAATSTALGVFARDPRDGTLRQVQSLRDPVSAVAVSADGRHVYGAGSGAVFVYRRAQ